MEAGDQQLVHTPFVPSGYCSPCAPLVWNPALKHDLIGFILRMLQNGFPSSVREPGQTRAYLIKALKAMQYSAVYGAKYALQMSLHKCDSIHADADTEEDDDDDDDVSTLVTTDDI
ncbi:unnamed protein product [Schistosoma mattheei]|uniref:Uncharacterized protein n=1 Tax=Schistosoma mattheei TaxID=31246 RepID=A0A183PL09_9TREM|nr:unnamed protein product [Schistosoma mattheei]